MRPTLAAGAASLLLLLASAVPAQAQPADSSATDRPTPWVFLPSLFSTPETGVAGGAVGIHFLDLPGNTPETPTSQVMATVIYTEKQQLILSVAPQLYLGDDAYRLRSYAEYIRFPDTFYGTGNDVPTTGERYTTTTLNLGAQVLKRLRPGLYAGPQLVVMDQRLSDVVEGGLLGSTDVTGQDGGLVAGVGAQVQWDRRDNPVYPTRGQYADVLVRLAQGAWGSDYAFGRVDLDLRAFVPVREAHVLALQGYAAYAGGEVPFTMLPQLGGSNQMRGHYAGRFRDQTFTTAQAEYRLPVWWRFGAAAFAGVGQVAASPGDLAEAPVRWSAGAGLRFALSRSERLNIRIDYGVGNDTSNLYITLGEAF